MRKTRRSYSAEFKREVVARAAAGNESFSAIERELGLPQSVVSRWVRAAERDGDQAFPGHGKRKAIDEEMYRLKRRLRDLTEEQAILKSALAKLGKLESDGSS